MPIPAPYEIFQSEINKVFSFVGHLNFLFSLIRLHS